MKDKSTNLTKEEVLQYISIFDRMDNRAYEVFKYAKTKYENVLAFGRFSSYSHCICDEDEASIRYDNSSDLYDTESIDMPLDDFLNNPNEFVDRWAADILKKREEQQRMKAAAFEDKERAEYERLKKKFQDA